MERFVDDYKFTACAGLIRWFYHRYLRGQVQSHHQARHQHQHQPGSLDLLPLPRPGMRNGIRPSQSTPTTPDVSSEAPLPCALLLAFALSHCAHKLGMPAAATLLFNKEEEEDDDDRDKDKDQLSGKEEAVSGGEDTQLLEPTAHAKPQHPRKQQQQQQHTSLDWQTFFQYYHMAVRRERAEVSGGDSVALLLSRRCHQVLTELRARHPRAASMDGERCAWILKPAHASRGKGIVIRTRLEDILAREGWRSGRGGQGGGGGGGAGHLVVQKYIERPLLIYECKFDIRQWIVVTNWAPLVVWINRTSYLRQYCTQFFTGIPIK